jgi:HlyD family secretion protein
MLRFLFVTIIALVTACSDATPQALGTLEWDRINARAIASEAIVEIYVAEGDQLDKDQPILKLDTLLQEAKVAQLTANVSVAQWQLEKLRAGYRSERVTAAEAVLNAATSDRMTKDKNYQRQRELRAKNLNSQNDVDSAENRYQSSIAVEKTASEQLHELRAGYRTEEIEQAQAQLTAAKAALRYQQLLLSRYIVTAERAARLDSLPFKLGDKPPTSAIIATLLAGDMPWARVYIPQPWLSQLAIGDAVSIRVDGREAALRGRIRYIASQASFTPYYAMAEDNRARLSYIAEIDLIDSEAQSLPVGIPLQMVKP